MNAPLSAMSLALLLPLFLASLALAARQEQTAPEAGMVITRSTRIAPGTYRLDSTDLDQPALTIRGENLEVDFSGVMLVGTDDPARPDQFKGLALKVEGNGVTVKGLAARGYKIALMARDAQKLTVRDCDFSYNWRQQMKSTPWQEDLSDWMSYHRNEKDEWLGYGSAVYLRNCDNFLITGVTVVGGQNGLMLTECDDGIIHSNQISFNSSLGLGMYRSSGNKVMHNRMDFNVRGHSEGVYNRGQDSAAILVYEQSSNNVFAWNSATHSGDGFFLWAGQSTMDTGEGGCNDNLLYQNDFSYAPTNGIEITFSRNQVVGNKLHGCWHGIWGGYSYDTMILANDFADNDDGVNIEHGQTNSIMYNTFRGCDFAIRLYERPNQDPGWGYPKHRDVASKGYTIALNKFAEVQTALWIQDTRSVQVFGNEFSNVVRELDMTRGEVNNVVPGQRPDADPEGRLKAFRPQEIQGAKTPSPLVQHPPKRDAIRVTQWGPYDYRRPVIWPEVAMDSSGMTLRLLAPAGEWRDLSAEGAQLERDAEGLVRVKAAKAQVIDMTVRGTWVGDRDSVDEFGRVVPAGTPVNVEYRRFAAPIDWNVKFFGYGDEAEPRSRPEAFAKLIAGEPVATTQTQRLDFRGTRPWAQGVPTERFATVAEGTLEAPEGEYVLELTSDDGVRLWLDGKLLHEDWTHHAPKTEQIRVQLGGTHTLRIEHFEIDGYAALKLELKKP